jgi:hypothetical protein
MKSLITLSVVQAGLLLFLIAKVASISEETPSKEHALPASTVSDRIDYSPGHGEPVVTYNMDEARLREIIREELQQNQQQPGSGQQPGHVPVLTSTQKADYDRRRDEVAQQLDYFTSVGSISDTDMQKLQTDIARLDPASRNEMLMELNRALNSGQLEGRL